MSYDNTSDTPSKRRTRYLRTREERLSYQKNYTAENREAKKKRDKAWYQKNKDRLKAERDARKAKKTA